MTCSLRVQCSVFMFILHWHRGKYRYTPYRCIDVLYETLSAGPRLHKAELQLPDIKLERKVRRCWWLGRDTGVSYVGTAFRDWVALFFDFYRVLKIDNWYQLIQVSIHWVEGFPCFADWIWLNVIPCHQGVKIWKSWCQEGRLRVSYLCQGCDLGRWNDHDVWIYNDIRYYDDIIWRWIEVIIIQLLEDLEVCRPIHGPRKSVLLRSKLRAWSLCRVMARRKWHTTGVTSDEWLIVDACSVRNSWQIGFGPADLLTTDFRWKAWSRRWHNLAAGRIKCEDMRGLHPLNESKQACMGFKMF